MGKNLIMANQWSNRAFRKRQKDRRKRNERRGWRIKWLRAGDRWLSRVPVYEKKCLSVA